MHNAFTIRYSDILTNVNTIQNNLKTGKIDHQQIATFWFFDAIYVKDVNGNSFVTHLSNIFVIERRKNNIDFSSLS